MVSLQRAAVQPPSPPPAGEPDEAAGRGHASRHPLRIGLDARDLLRQRTGVQRMWYHFVDSLPRYDARHRYVLFVDREPAESRWRQPPFELVVEPPRFGPLQALFDTWLTVQLPRLLRDQRIDLFYSPNTKLPPVRLPTFTTIHGLEAMRFPEGYRLAERIRHWAWFQICTRWSSGIVTFASSTREDLRTLRPTCRVPVCVTPEGVDSMFRVLDPSERSPLALQALGVRAPFVLSVCSHEPRKNLDTLLRSFAEAVRRLGTAHQLVLVGRSGWKSERLDALIEQLGLAPRVLRPGYVDDDQLVQLYNQADLFAFPSRYEGFGLPVLEGMSCGVPVLTSSCSSLPEVAGGAALLVDPDSVEDVTRGMLEVLADPARCEALRTAGLERASQFSWQSMTDRICGFMIEHANRTTPGSAR